MESLLSVYYKNNRGKWRVRKVPYAVSVLLDRIYFAQDNFSQLIPGSFEGPETEKRETAAAELELEELYGRLKELDPVAYDYVTNPPNDEELNRQIISDMIGHARNPKHQEKQNKHLRRAVRRLNKILDEDDRQERDEAVPPTSAKSFAELRRLLGPQTHEFLKLLGSTPHT